MTNKIVCPHCGCDKGFFTKERVTGSATTFYNSNGDCEEDQSIMYDHLRHYGGTRAFCKGCERYLGKTEDLASGEQENEAGVYNWEA